MNYQPTEEQIAIDNAIATTTHDIVIDALAGSGKTTSLLSALQRISAPSVLMTAFNKRIADTLTEKVGSLNRPSNQVVHVRTFHALGFGIMKHHFPHLRGAGSVEAKATEDLINQADQHAPFRLRSIATRFLRVVKEHIVTRQPLIDELIAHGHRFSCFADRKGQLSDREIEQVADLAYAGYVAGIKFRDRQTIDFCDQIWGPIVLDLAPQSRYLAVIVDEMQDISSLQLALIKRLLVPGKGRLIGVGDRNQAIYGWRGAEPDVVWKEFEGRNAKTFPLTTCFRCPASVIHEARDLVPTIRARENAPEGSVTMMASAEALAKIKGAALSQANTFVLSRNNATLFSFAMRAWSKGVEFQLNAAREILDPLFATLAALNTFGSREAFMDSLILWHTKETARAQKANATEWAERIEEQYAMLSAAVAYTEPSNIERLIRDMLSDDRRTTVLFSSVHKVKGLEADHVFLLRDSFARYQKRRSDDQEAPPQEELNLEYVAITRAKKSLTWILEEK